MSFVLARLGRDGGEGGRVLPVLFVAPLDSRMRSARPLPLLAQAVCVPFVSIAIQSERYEAIFVVLCVCVCAPFASFHSILRRPARSAVAGSARVPHFSVYSFSIRACLRSVHANDIRRSGCVQPVHG